MARRECDRDHCCPGSNELTLANNRAVVTVTGVRDRFEGLCMVSGEPHAGERVWRSLLKADPSRKST